jgi:type IV pilus assembly protein PilA
MRKKGFSLIDFLIVVAIVLIITAIVLPGFLRARAAERQKVAVHSIRAISAAEEEYRKVQPDAGYSMTLGQLGPAGAKLIDGELATGAKDGYTVKLLDLAGPAPTTYTVVASPNELDVNYGAHYLCSTENGVVRESGVPIKTCEDSLKPVE